MALLLQQNRQLSIITESVQGDYETALDSSPDLEDNADFLLINPSITPSGASSDRQIRTATLTPTDQFAPGVSSVELSFSTELATSTFNLGATDWVRAPVGRLLSYCGWRSVSKAEVDATTPSLIPVTWGGGPPEQGSELKHLEILTKANPADAGRTFTCLGGGVDGLDTHIFAQTGTGAFPAVGENFQGGETKTMVTVGTPSVLQRYLLYPVSDPASWNTASAIYLQDGKRWRLKGMRGTAELQFEHAQPPRVVFTMRAVVESTTDAALITRQKIAHQDPLPFLGTNFRLHDGTDEITGIVFNTMSIAQNNTLVLRENSSDSDGWSFTSIASRAFTGSINFDERTIADMPGTSDYHDYHKLGTLLHARMLMSETPGAGRDWEARIEGLQFTSLAEADRDNFTTWDAQFALRSRTFTSATTGENDHALGEDSEIVLINTGAATPP